MLISITYTKKEIEISFLVFKYFLSIISSRKYSNRTKACWVSHVEWVIKRNYASNVFLQIPEKNEINKKFRQREALSRFRVFQDFTQGWWETIISGGWSTQHHHTKAQRTSFVSIFVTV